MTDKMLETATEYGMKINIKKTKVMKISQRPGEEFVVLLDDEQLSQVTYFNYLGSLMTQDGHCKKDIRSKIAWAKNCVLKQERTLNKIFQS